MPWISIELRQTLALTVTSFERGDRWVTDEEAAELREARLVQERAEALLETIEQRKKGWRG